MIIAIGNVGSTSLKSKILDINDKNEIKTLGEANLDKIKSEGESNFTYKIGNGESAKETVNVMGFKNGIKLIFDWYIANGVISQYKDIEAVGFKTILGETNGANLLTPSILDELKRFAFVAPVHNLPYLEAIEEFKKVLGNNTPLVGVFEPSFHYSIPEHRKMLGFPWKWYEELKIRQNGFHGSSHRYMSAMVYKLEGTDKLKLITVHLGGSSSICAHKNGKSVDVSMKFSTDSGLLQGTRIGDCDGIGLLFAMKSLGLSVEDAQKEISTNAGLKGMAGIGTDDYREIYAAGLAGNERCSMTISAFIDGVRKYIGAFSAILGGVDVIAFGGGIAEKGKDTRNRILENMEYMGVRIDIAKNEDFNGKQALISSADSKVKLYITPTNEEIVVAYFVKKVVETGRDLKPEEMTFRL
ncbi:MAG: acetate/propionate family kinase [Candidatus Humimicrobiaceae bacterium]